MTHKNMIPSLTQLTEDEQMLKEATADFAQSSIAPLVQKMDEHAKLDQSVNSINVLEWG